MIMNMDMADKRSHDTGDGSGVSRRTFVQAAGATGATVGLAGCIYGGEGSSDAVVFGFDPDAGSEVGDEIKDLFYESGLDEDVEVQLQEGDQDTGERRDNYINLLEAEETQPDLFLMDNGWTNIFIQRGYIANLEEELEDDDLARVDEEYFEEFTDTVRDAETGDLYGVPLFPDFPTMQYRKDYAREAGYDDDDFEEWATEPMSWQEWAELTEEIVEASDAEYGFATQWDIYEGTACCTWNEVMTSWGGGYFGGQEHLFGPVGDRDVTVDEEEFVDALRMMRTFVADEHDDDTLEEYPTGIATSSITSWQEQDSLDAILGGEAVMQRNWPFAIVEGAGEFGTDDWGVMPMPYAVSESEANQPGTGGSTSALGGWHVVLNPNAENRAAAVEVLRTLMTDEFNLGMLELWGWLPPKPTLFESEEAESIEPIGEYMETLRVAGENAMPRPVTEVWSSQADTIAEEVNQAVSGDKSPEDAASDLQESLEEIEQG